MTKPHTDTQPLTKKPFSSVDDLSSPWDSIDVIVLPAQKSDRYCVGYARSTRAVERALRLRYEVFNLELNEGLESSSETGMDRDEYDEQMTHLILIEQATDAVVGTYRIQTARHAEQHRGLYSAIEYDLSDLEPYLDETLELGRACLAADHRSMRAIIGLWKGIGSYMNFFGQHYLFGCCSLTTQDTDDAWRAMKTIRAKEYLHETLYLSALEANRCGDPAREFEDDLGDAIPLPKLFRTYLNMGASVISEPAIDRAFGTIDFLVLIDARVVSFSQLDIVK